MAVPTWVAAGTKNNKPSSSGTTSSVSAPAGHATGDLLVIASDIYASPALITLATPSGWTLLGVSSFWGDDSHHHGYLFWKLAASSSEPAVTLTTSAGGFNDSQMYAFRGVSATTPIDVGAVFGAQSTVANVATPALTTVTADTLLVYIGFEQQSTAWNTPPAGATEQVETSPYVCKFIVATEPKAAAGVEAADVYVRGSGGTNGFCAAFAVSSGTAAAAAFVPQITIV